MIHHPHLVGDIANIGQYVHKTMTPLTHRRSVGSTDTDMNTDTDTKSDISRKMKAWTWQDMETKINISIYAFHH